MYNYNYSTLKKITETERGKKFIENLERKYNDLFAGKPIRAFTFGYVKDYYRNQDRLQHEIEFLDRRRRLKILQILAVADDKYLEELEEILAAIVDEYTWALPAHNYIKEDNTFDNTVIDLYSAETGFYLSETVYVLGDKLSPEIRKRIRISVADRIVKNYESRDFVWTSLSNNWAAVCACGVGLCYLYLFAERFDKVKDKLFSTLASYTDGIDNEGYCYEGVGYWEYGFGFFSVFFDVYVQLTGERPAILYSDKVRNLLKYIERVRMEGAIYIPFADGGSKEFKADPSICYAIKNLFGDDFQLPILRDFIVPVKSGIESARALGFRVLYGISNFNIEAEDISRKEQVISYKNAQISVYKKKEYSLVVKCGSNSEPHNHNDVGAFQLVKNGERLIVDYGAGEYTNGYFNSPDVRYGEKVFVCGSFSHSVPIVDGKVQHNGEYRGELLEQSEKKFVMDIAGAYNKENAQSLIVKYEPKESSVKVSYFCKGIEEKIVFRFVSEVEPEIKNGGVFLRDAKVIDSLKVAPKISKIEFSGHGGVHAVVYALDYEITRKGEVEANFEFCL